MASNTRQTAFTGKSTGKNNTANNDDVTSPDTTNQANEPARQSGYDPNADFSPEYLAASAALDACTTSAQIHQLLRTVYSQPEKEISVAIVEGMKEADDAKKARRAAVEKSLRSTVSKVFRRRSA